MEGKRDAAAVGRRALRAHDGLGVPAQTRWSAKRPPRLPPRRRKTLEARYTRPYQAHGSIGPSCAVAQVGRTASCTVWTHSQGVYPAARRSRQGVRHRAGERPLHPRRRRGLLRPQRRRRRGARRGAARARDRRPAGQAAVDARRRVQWEPYGSAMVMKLGGAPRRAGQHRQLVARALEPSAQHAPGPVEGRRTRWRRGTWRSRSSCRSGRRRAAAGGRRATATRSRSTTSRTSEVVKHFMPEIAAAHLGAAHARRLRQRVRARVVHRRAGARRRAPTRWNSACGT